MYVLVCISVDIFLYVSVRMFVHKHVRMPICVSLCMFVYECEHVRIVCENAYLCM